MYVPNDFNFLQDYYYYFLFEETSRAIHLRYFCCIFIIFDYKFKTFYHLLFVDCSLAFFLLSFTKKEELKYSYLNLIFSKT